MKGVYFQAILSLIVCTLAISAASADTLIYNNSNYQGSYAFGYNYPIYDYGTSAGGLVNKIVFGYYNPSSSTSSATITFYRYPYWPGYDPGYIVKTITVYNLPPSTGQYRAYERVLPEQDRFELPSGNFGYTIAVSSSSTGLAIASGGSGQQDELWEYYDHWLYGWGWHQFVFTNAWSGLYMKIYTGPPIDEITCDISGSVFDDADGDGTWDAGESAMSGWEIYVDTNGNDQFDPGTDPNVVTDPNGGYFFENLDSPATYTIREVMKDGWSQTLPDGPDYEYTIDTEPNNVYGPYDFGNTDQPLQDVTFSGTLTWEDDTPFAGITVNLDLDGNPFTAERTTVTNENGFYEFTLTPPWTGMLILDLPDRWISHWTGTHENVTTDIVEDFTCTYQYDAGDGSTGDPYQIRTADQLLMINHQWSHFDKHFVLMNDIDLAGTTYSDAIIPSFSGQFDGAGFSVLNLQSNNGLFGIIREGVIKNLGVENVDITGASSTGAICRSNYGGVIENCFSTGNISGLFDVGGICAWVHAKCIVDCPISPPTVGTPVIKNCYSTVNVTLNIPNNFFPEWTSNSAGGLCAYAEGADIFNNYASGTVSAKGCHTLAGFDAIADNGGLLGQVENCNIYNNYSSGHVVDGLAYSNPGGFCGAILGEQNTLLGNFWDIETSDQSTSPCGTGLTTEQMQLIDTYTGWDFDAVWRICDGMNYPRLQREPKPVGDFVCPEGVEINDLMVLTDEWLAETMTADMAPDGGDGMVNLLDWIRFASAWQSQPGDPAWDDACDLAPTPQAIIGVDDLMVFSEQWLAHSAYFADIAPVGAPDGKVDLSDYCVFAENWRAGTD